MYRKLIIRSSLFSCKSQNGFTISLSRSARVSIRPKTWVGPFDSHKHRPRERSIDTAVASIALGLGRWNTFGTHVANIEESPPSGFWFLLGKHRALTQNLALHLNRYRPRLVSSPMSVLHDKCSVESRCIQRMPQSLEVVILLFRRCQTRQDRTPAYSFCHHG
jgi:hypothetical protein